MAIRAKNFLALTIACALLAACLLLFQRNIGLVVFMAAGLFALILFARVIARRASPSRLTNACRALADAFWGIG